MAPKPIYDSILPFDGDTARLDIESIMKRQTSFGAMCPFDSHDDFLQAVAPEPIEDDPIIPMDMCATFQDIVNTLDPEELEDYLV